MEKLFTKSDGFKEEYCCSIVSIGELIPVEGSDFLAKTNILGTQIVVRKDQVREGQLVFYAANETSLNEKFLSINNLYEIGCRDMNSNSEEVNKIMSEYDTKYRKEADELRVKAKNIKSKINSFTINAVKYNKKIDKLKGKLLDISTDESEEYIENINNEIKELQEKVDNYTSKAVSLTVSYTNTKKKIEDIVNDGKYIVEKAKKHTGFFNKYGRVRCITLKGELSFGFIFGIDEMEKYCPKVKEINLEEYIGEDFDTVNGELFVKAFIPPIKQQNERRNKNNKRNKKLKQFDRILDGEFSFHYDTEPIKRNIGKFNPDTPIIMDVKFHGTSVIISKIHVKEQKEIAIYKKLWNKLVDCTGLFTSTRFIDYNIVYGPVYSSRTVIKNKYINQNVNSGYYSQDIWSEYGDIIYPYLDEGMSLYGEICGYLTNSSKMIQKHYDYGCKEGENILMPYRITTINEDGTKKEWEVREVYDWTLSLIKKMKENNDDNYKRIQPLVILYEGTFGELYPDLDITQHWHEDILKKLDYDKENFGANELEPLCNNKVPREGLVIRIVGDKNIESFKEKFQAFLLKEALLIDAGEVDIEMIDNYSNVIVCNYDENH